MQRSCGVSPLQNTIRSIDFIAFSIGNARKYEWLAMFLDRKSYEINGYYKMSCNDNILFSGVRTEIQQLTLRYCEAVHCNLKPVR